MRDKEKWMFPGASVLACEKRGIITQVIGSKLDETKVAQIKVRIHGQREPGVYHPDDVKELKHENTFY